jgi:hypothetical protein
MSKGVDYLSNLYVNNLPKPPFVDVNEDRRSTTIVLVWFLYFLEFFPMSKLSVLGEGFSCRFLIQVLRYFRHEVS